MKKSLIHLGEGAAVALLGAVPAALASPGFQHFIAAHPGDAAYLPIAAGVASAAYRWAKKRYGAKVSAAPVK